MAQTSETTPSEELEMDYTPEDIIKLQQYTKEKLLKGDDTIVNNPVNRTKKNIVMIIDRILSFAQSENLNNGSVLYNFPPSVLANKRTRKSKTVSAIFDRAKSDYDIRPDILLNDLNIVDDYYILTGGQEVESGEPNSSQDPNFIEALEIALKKTPPHFIYGVPKVSEFYIVNGIIKFKGKNPIRGIDYTTIISIAQNVYDSL